MTSGDRAGPVAWPSTRPVRLGVIGTGSMGRNHLRVYDTLKNVELVGLYDPNSDLAEALSQQYRCRAFSSLQAATEEIDAASICAPSSLHCAVGLPFLEAGIHCLIEKPLATRDTDCLALIAAAADSKAKLLVGHIERHNPAVRQLEVMLAARGQKIRAIDTRRLSSVSSRAADIDVVADLMVHDLDIVAALANGKVGVVAAAAVGASGDADHVTALLDLGNNAIATLTASRITHSTIRQISVTTDAALIEVDYINQSVEVFSKDRVRTSSGPAAQFGDYALDIAMERVQVRRTEPLHVQLSHFIDTIRHDMTPLVTGEDGLLSLRLAMEIRNNIRAQVVSDAAD